MPAAMKVFSTKTSDALPTISFAIELTNPKGETKQLAFEAYTDPPANALVVMARMIRVNGKGEQFMDPSLLGEAFTDVIIQADRDRWQSDVMDNTEWMVPSTTLGEVFQWLQEAVWERPTGPSSGSSTTQSDSGAGSTANAPSVASTSPAS